LTAPRAGSAAILINAPQRAVIVHDTEAEPGYVKRTALRADSAAILINAPQRAVIVYDTEA
jgi:hypothetical protein